MSRSTRWCLLAMTVLAFGPHDDRTPTRSLPTGTIVWIDSSPHLAPLGEFRDDLPELVGRERAQRLRGYVARHRTAKRDSHRRLIVGRFRDDDGVEAAHHVVDGLDLGSGRLRHLLRGLDPLRSLLDGLDPFVRELE